ncbi:MAG: hypothetical protein ISN28_15625 [Ectothiorhodospiraceae bacterium AqS1]|nr:hypothetical protein [Ectothiorhodospiraceae bacterium AqS1]MBF2761662.1 hypothetical protein [Ectothiorhodospiraceae bacterium AqS1]
MKESEIDGNTHGNGGDNRHYLAHRLCFLRLPTRQVALDLGNLGQRLLLILIDCFEFVIDLVDEFIELFVGLLESFIGFFVGLLESFIDLGNELIEVFGGFLVGLLKPFIDLGNELVELFGGFFVGLLKPFIDLGNELVEVFVDLVEPLFQPASIEIGIHRNDLGVVYPFRRMNQGRICCIHLSAGYAGLVSDADKIDIEHDDDIDRAFPVPLPPHLHITLADTEALFPSIDSVSQHTPYFALQRLDADMEKALVFDAIRTPTMHRQEIRPPQPFLQNVEQHRYSTAIHHDTPCLSFKPAAKRPYRLRLNGISFDSALSHHCGGFSVYHINSSR